MKDIVERWLARLRDPNTQRVKGFLKQGDCFCAVGLLLDVIDPTLWKSCAGIESYQGHMASLPKAAKDRFDRQWLDTIIIKSDNGISFPEIADYIERTWHERHC